jgi:hypothetical protein
LVKLLERTIEPSPRSPAHFRVAARIAVDGGSRVLNVWFEFPNECRDGVTESGNAWLVLMLPMALTTGENIELSLPVDPHLLENARGMMRFWHNRFPEFHPVEIHAPSAAGTAGPGARRALFFSGGIDSTFSLLRHDKTLAGCATGTVDDLIFIAGLDIRISDSREVDLAKQHLEQVATAHGKTLIAVDTNLRELDSAYNNNWLLFYGCALGTVGHLLDRRYREVICASEQSYANLNVTGSHPVSDSLLASRHLRFVHDGASFTRVEKTLAVGEAGAPLKLLRVCWESRRHDNCSRCSKCLRTMVTLDIAGYRDQARCFDWSDYRVDKLGGIFLYNRGQTLFFEEILAEAQRRGRQDVVDVVSRIIRLSVRTRAITDWVRHAPLLWRWEYHVRELLLRRYFRNPRTASVARSDPAPRRRGWTTSSR